MDRERIFAQALERLRALAKEQGNCVSKEQVAEAFGELKLRDEQLVMVYEYLKQHKIGVEEALNPEDYLSAEEVDYLEDYLVQLQGFSDISEGEKEAVTLSAMAGDTDAQRRMIQIFLPQVAEIAKLYAGQGVFLEDLIGEGNVALTMGVTMLGALEHAAEAEGMLARMIMDAMEELIAENAREEKEDKKLADKVNKVADKARELAQEMQRKVTVEELMNETGMSRKTIMDAMDISGDKIESIMKV
ncbi:MAG: hypothetical protein NC314_10495 [Roseburia sp.]|nr:hypothetical protein [Roseburia sp.]MCM1243260.1 hypothetical protein [Roseburia sp.]